MELNKIYHSDALSALKTFPNESINMACTSPPYWGLRDYGTAKWEGGDTSCNHIDIIKYEERLRQKKSMIKVGDRIDGSTRSRIHDEQIGSEWQYIDVCKKCGAIRIDKQLGLEKTPEEYVNNLVEIFREVKRVLKKDGTLWLNLGDSYMGGKGQSGQAWSTGHLDRDTLQKSQHQISGKGEIRPNDRKHESIKPKDLVGIPWMTAFALRADGWWLRQDIIWNKPNPMPESVQDRCTKAHEYIFLLTKSQKYYYDYEAILEPANYDGRKDTAMKGSQKYANGYIPTDVNNQSITIVGHERWPRKMKDTGHGGDGTGFKKHSGCINQETGEYIGPVKEGLPARNKRSVWTVNTKPFSDAHFATFPEELIDPMIKAGCPENGIVLDPFMGAGTTGLVSRKLNRNYIGIELNAEYIKIAENRILPVEEIKEMGYAKTKLNNEHPTLF